MGFIIRKIFGSALAVLLAALLASCAGVEEPGSATFRIDARALAARAGGSAATREFTARIYYSYSYIKKTRTFDFSADETNGKYSSAAAFTIDDLPRGQNVTFRMKVYARGGSTTPLFISTPIGGAVARVGADTDVVVTLADYSLDLDWEAVPVSVSGVAADFGGKTLSRADLHFFTPNGDKIATETIPLEKCAYDAGSRRFSADLRTLALADHVGGKVGAAVVLTFRGDGGGESYCAGYLYGQTVGEGGMSLGFGAMAEQDTAEPMMTQLTLNLWKNVSYGENGEEFGDPFDATGLKCRVSMHRNGDWNDTLFETEVPVSSNTIVLRGEQVQTFEDGLKFGVHLEFCNGGEEFSWERVIYTADCGNITFRQRQKNGVDVHVAPVLSWESCDEDGNHFDIPAGFLVQKISDSSGKVLFGVEDYHEHGMGGSSHGGIQELWNYSGTVRFYHELSLYESEDSYRSGGAKLYGTASPFAFDFTVGRVNRWNVPIKQF